MDWSEIADWRAGARGDIRDDLELLITASTAAELLIREMRENPDCVWCANRRCGHTASAHRGTCLVRGCDCDQLVESRTRLAA